MQQDFHAPTYRAGFSLLELLVAFAVLALLMVLLAEMVGATASTWRGTRGKVEQHQQAREAFEAVISRLSEATLNTHYEYEDKDGMLKNATNSRTFQPARYARQSELRFLSGPGITEAANHVTHAAFFQAPAGESKDGRSLQNLLNTFGFFVELGDDAPFLPPLLRTDHARERFRLLQFTEPTESLSVYRWTGANPLDRERKWFQEPLATGSGLSIVADNVIALVLLPMLSPQDQEAGGYSDASLAPQYLYDSTGSNTDPALNPRHQLPPVVQVTLIALDEASAARMTGEDRAALKSLLDTLFPSSGNTLDPSPPGFARDLKSLEDFLNARRLNYRVFQSNVPIKTAKWSREQKN
jgi:uncharacterized protein (TIGR02599 family)